MTKTTALDLALDLFKSKGTVTPLEINKHVGKGNYASKYVLYLKLRGHDISTNKKGRTVVDYTYNGINQNVDTNMKVSERRARNFLNVGNTKPTLKVKVDAKAKAKTPTKKDKPRKEAKASTKPVMTKEEIKKATAAILALRAKDAKAKVNEVLTETVPVSSFAIDSDWDNSGSLDARELGL